MPAVLYPSFILRGLKLIVRSDNNSILLPDCPCQRQIIPIQVNIWISHKFPIHNIHPTTVCGRQWETKSELSRESQSSLECWGKVLRIFYLLWSFFSSHVVFVALTSMFERPIADCWVLSTEQVPASLGSRNSPCRSFSVQLCRSSLSVDVRFFRGLLDFSQGVPRSTFVFILLTWSDRVLFWL